MYVSFSLLKTKFTKNIVISNHKILKCYIEVMLIIKYFKNNLKEYFGFIDYQWKKNMEKGFLSIYVRTFNNKKAVLGPYITCCHSPKSLPIPQNDRQLQDLL